MTPISTWDLLLSLGFVPDARVYSNPPGGLSLNFGNFELKAIYVLNRYFRSVIMLMGVMSTARTISEVECEMPEEVESAEQGIAWVTYCLDQHAPGGVFVPAREVPWLEIGRQYKHLLPWEQQMAAYAARPICWAGRDFVRAALRDLARLLSEADKDAQIVFSFDGEVLMIRVAGGFTAIPARGEKWDRRFCLNATRFWGPPKRLHDPVSIVVGGGAITIGNYLYHGVEEVDSNQE